MATLSIHSHEKTTALIKVAVTPPPPPEKSVAAAALPSNSLYVGDLDPSVDEAQLSHLFNQAAKVVSVRVCKDKKTPSSLGYAYVNFSNQQDASKAKEMFNFKPINGKPMRVMFCHRDSTLRNNAYANVFIKNLDSSIDNKVLHDKFSPFGTILSCKVALDSNGNSKRYGFVQYEREESAQKAIKELNEKIMNENTVYVGLFVSRQDRNRTEKFTNIYVKNFSETTNEDELKKVFGKYGSITSAIVVKDENGVSKSFGFINFEKAEEAAAAVEDMNGSLLGEKVIYVGKAQKKADRKAQLRAKYEEAKSRRFQINLI